LSSISSTISDEGRVYILGRNALPKNFIEDGLEILPGTGLSAKISTGTLDIGGIYLDLSSDTSIDLSPRMAALLYAKYQPGTEYPTIGKVNCVNPLTFVDANTVGLWIFNQTTAGVAIPNSAVGVSSIAVANDLTPFGGLTSVDGHFDYAIKGDGTSGYYISANSTGIPTGALEFHHTCLFTPKSFAATQYLLSYGTHTASNTQVSIVLI
jgi:hypothetical protein